MSLGDTIRSLRKAKGYTQKEVADLLQVSSSAVAMYERDEREPSIDILKRLTLIFKTDLNSLCGTPYKGYKISFDESSFSEGEKVWIELYNKVSDEAKIVLTSLMAAFERIPEDRQKFVLEMIRVAINNY